MKQQILVIDDSESVHPFVKAILANESVEIHSAMDAKYGMVLATSICPDLILLDVDMPQMNGFDACQQLKADPATANCPIIFLTAQSSPKEKVHGFGLGAVDYVTKPFNPSELLARVQSSLRTRVAIRDLEDKVLTDPLTGMWNLAMFDQRLKAEIALRSRFDVPLSVIALDVDRFTKINDVFGSETGNEVLQKVGKAVTSLCRTEDVACRIGGDEMAIISPHTSAAAAEIFAERIRKAIGEIRLTAASSGKSACSKEQMHISASFGVAAATDSHDRSMLHRAGEALEAAKGRGGNCIVASAADTASLSIAA